MGPLVPRQLFRRGDTKCLPRVYPSYPLLDEAMLQSPSKPGQAKEEQQSDIEDVEEVGTIIKNKNTRTSKRIAKGPDCKTKFPPVSKIPVTPAPILPSDGQRGRFTPTMQRVVDEALATEDLDLIGIYGDVTLTGKGIHTLAEGEQLDDSPINAYLQLIKVRSRMAGYPKIFRYDTSFYSILSTSRAGFTPRYAANMFHFDYVFIPVNPINHWVFVHVCIKTRTVFYMDSLFSKTRADRILGNIKGFMYNSSVILHGVENAWVFKTEICTVPQQTNGIDCGVFACQFAEHVARGAGLGFNQSDIPRYRKTMVWELMARRLIWNQARSNTSARRPPPRS